MLLLVIDDFYLANNAVFQREEVRMGSRALLAIMAIITVLLISFVKETDSTPGHLVHDFYKCESEYFQAFFKRCKRNLPNHRNSALSAHSPTNLVVMVLTASLTLLVSRT